MPRKSGLIQGSSDEAARLAVDRAYRLLRDANRAIIVATGEQALLEQVCLFIVKNGYRMAWVGQVLPDEARSIKPVASAGIDAGYLQSIRVTWADDALGQGPTGTAARERRIVVNQNFLTNPQMAPWRDTAIRHGYQSSIALPLKLESGAVFAVVNIYAAEADAFDAGEVEKLSDLADMLSFGHATLVGRQLRFDVLEKSVAALATTVESRDPYTAGHMQRVSRLAESIARNLGLDAETCTGIRLAGLIHDIGKIHIPIEYLTTPRRLTEIEMTVIRTHADVGYGIVKDIPFPWPVAGMVHQHHERWDGSGYPQGLKGEGILLGARILAVADVVEAISTHRPYRPERGLDAALQEIQSGSGVLFDPAVVESCIPLLRRLEHGPDNPARHS